MQRQVLTIGATNYARLRLLFDEIDEAFLTGATATCDIVLDPEGTPVSGAQGISMTEVSGTADEDTLYIGEISHTAALTPRKYKAVILVISASGQRRPFRQLLVAEN